MRILRWDSVGGASGDMILGALIALGADSEVITRELKKIFSDTFELILDKKESHGLNGVQLTVAIPGIQYEEKTGFGHHHHHGAESDHQKDGEQDLGHHHIRKHEGGPEHDGNGENADKTEFLNRHGHEHDGNNFWNDQSESSEGYYHYGHGHHHHHRENVAEPGKRTDDENTGFHEAGTHAHVHRSFADIREMIQKSSLDEEVRRNAIDVFQAIAVAEGKVHGRPADEVRFHEVGATDSLIDIIGSCLAIHLLKIDGISLSPLPVGEGTVKCAHGIYPVPAPATSLLLQNLSIPVSTENNEQGEMLTPTGAALLGVWKKMDIPTGYKIQKSVNSFGHREMKSCPNLLRATIYENIEENNGLFPEELPQQLIQFECNIDDASGEILASAMAAIFSAGALDVWHTPVMMKKGRPGILLGVLVSLEHRWEVLDAIFKHSRTFGVREQTVLRYALARRWEEVRTEFGVIRMKIGTHAGQDIHFSPEFEDCQQAAQNHHVSVTDVIQKTMVHYLKEF